MKKLRNILILNGVSSGLTGVGLVAWPRFMADLFDVESSLPFYSVGIFLLAFALAVISVGTAKVIVEKYVRLIVVLDICWVLASAIVIFMPLQLSAIGIGIIVAIGIWVAAMAYFQGSGLKQLTPKA